MKPNKGEDRVVQNKDRGGESSYIVTWEAGYMTLLHRCNLWYVRAIHWATGSQYMLISNPAPNSCIRGPREVSLPDAPPAHCSKMIIGLYWGAVRPQWILSTNIKHQIMLMIVLQLSVLWYSTLQNDNLCRAHTEILIKQNVPLTRKVPTSSH